MDENSRQVILTVMWVSLFVSGIWHVSELFRRGQQNDEALRQLFRRLRFVIVVVDDTSLSSDTIDDSNLSSLCVNVAIQADKKSAEPAQQDITSPTVGGCEVLGSTNANEVIEAANMTSDGTGSRLPG